MDATLHCHDAKYFPLPLGLKELSSDITREVLRCQPDRIYCFIADYVNALLTTRERAREASIIVKEILEFDLTYQAMLMRRGISVGAANRAATIIQAAFRGYTARSLFAKRHWLVSGFDLLSYLQARGLTPETATVYVIKIQAYYRGYVCRKIMQNVFNYAVGKINDQVKGKDDLVTYLALQGVDEEDAADITENILFKYTAMAADYEVDDDLEPELDAEAVEDGATEGAVDSLMPEEGSQPPTPEESTGLPPPSAEEPPPPPSPPLGTADKGSPPVNAGAGDAEESPQAEPKVEEPPVQQPPKEELASE